MGVKCGNEVWDLVEIVPGPQKSSFAAADAVVALGDPFVTASLVDQTGDMS